MSRVVVSVGGEPASRSAEAVLELARDDEVCVVHDAVAEISLQMERAGIPVEFVDGLRVTTTPGLEIVRSSLETANEALCAAIGERAVPLIGHAVGLEAAPIPQLGRVGAAEPSELPAVVDALDAGKIPVVAPIARALGQPGLLNVSADDAAAAIAIGIKATRLLFLSGPEGFLLGGEVVDTLGVAHAEELFFHGELDPAILPRLGAAITAARWGVTAFIGRTELTASPRERVLR